MRDHEGPYQVGLIIFDLWLEWAPLRWMNWPRSENSQDGHWIWMAFAEGGCYEFHGQDIKVMSQHSILNDPTRQCLGWSWKRKASTAGLLAVKMQKCVGKHQLDTLGASGSTDWSMGRFWSKKPASLYHNRNLIYAIEKSLLPTESTAQESCIISILRWPGVRPGASVVPPTRCSCPWLPAFSFGHDLTTPWVSALINLAGRWDLCSWAGIDFWGDSDLSVGSWPGGLTCSANGILPAG